MNIYLTSYGLDTRYKDYMKNYKEIIELLRDKKVAIIPNAKLISQDRTNSIVAKEELNKNNIKAVIVDLDKEILKVDNFDALYLSGGEPKNLMDSIHNAKLFHKIEKFIDKGGVVVGESAGAMIFSKKYLDTTTDKLLVLKNGFDYASKLIVPHYDSLPEDILKHLPKDILKIKNNDSLIKLNKDKLI